MKVERGKFRHMNAAELRSRGFWRIPEFGLQRVSGLQFFKSGDSVVAVESTVEKFVRWHCGVDNGIDWQIELRLLHSVARTHLMADPK